MTAIIVNHKRASSTKCVDRTLIRRLALLDHLRTRHARPYLAGTYRFSAIHLSVHLVASRGYGYLFCCN